MAALVVLACLGAHGASAGQTVPVPRVTIYPGDSISDATLEEREISLGREPERAWHLSREQLLGKIARRTLLPGQAIPLNAVKAPDLVRAGKAVTLVFAVGQLVITGRGLAMQAGGPGESITLQSQDSGAVVRGVIAVDGTVRVGD